MGALFNIIRSLGLDSVLRARVLQELRVVGGMAAGALATWLASKGVSQSDALAIGAAVSALIVAAGSAGFSWADPQKVDDKMTSTHADGAVAAATLIASGKATPQQITALSGSPAALKELLARLSTAPE